jgi:hypothetical protein
MDPITAPIIAEGIKAVFAMVITYGQQQGLTEAQIEANFDAALAGVLARDPSSIPDPK